MKHDNGCLCPVCMKNTRKRKTETIPKRKLIFEANYAGTSIDSKNSQKNPTKNTTPENYTNIDTTIEVPTEATNEKTANDPTEMDTDASKENSIINRAKDTINNKNIEIEELMTKEKQLVSKLNLTAEEITITSLQLEEAEKQIAASEI